MLAIREAFAVARHCPVIEREVTLSGTHVSGSSGDLKEIARKTCSKLRQCYGDHRYLVPVAGCLLGNPGI